MGRLGGYLGGDAWNMLGGMFNGIGEVWGGGFAVNMYLFINWGGGSRALRTTVRTPVRRTVRRPVRRPVCSFMKSPRCPNG